MDKAQLSEFIIKPTLKKIPKGFTEESVMAIEMIIAHESFKGKYIKQIGGGPALGLIQMEPETHNDTWKHGDSIWDNALKVGIVNNYDHQNKIHPTPDRLIYDLSYNVFMARQRLFMKKGALPSSPGYMSMYLKENWNTVFGKADSYSYLNDWKEWQ